ncbi:MAG: bifunctional glutamate N-acetyltransferase/amino-acid acetyltransferase ArgJ [Burkholderiales bacterium]|jgi:glutamate N-acetyltransferase/amino-acid N-acetyltransferase|nr:bifunctional glutamate N-acetyltransferase/amino-acid acetyltransferase ArgJ [Burkholderiales bacterium]
MPVNCTPPTADSLLPVPGVVLGTAAARIKNWDRDDVLLVVCDPGTVAAGVFTQNRFCAAPVTVCRAHLARQHERRAGFRALVVNAGNANAGTGAAGLADAHAECVAVARLLDCAPEDVLPYSTGVIMEPLPVAKIVAALPAAKAAARVDGWFAAAKAIMTTDTVPKGASRRVSVDGVPVTVTGIAKGAGMIHPDMATMLAFMATDAPLSAPLLAQVVREVADVSFNGATVDGDTSTNDSFVLAATGRARLDPIVAQGDARLVPIRRAIEECAVALAQAIVRDGEGATKFIAIRVDGGRTVDECRRVAFGIAHSPLVKTAFFASDPNLGRIVCAIGNAAAPDTDPARVSFWLDDVLVVDRGGRAAAYREEDGQRVMKRDEIAVRVDLGRGSAAATVWTCDFSHDYVSINADYRS